MQCPRCNELLHVAHREGIEIDHCPRCRGVWLDRGELEKLVGLTMQQAAPGGYGLAPAPRPAYSQEAAYTQSFGRKPDDSDEWDFRQAQAGKHPQHYGQQPKKKSFWSNLFDFD